MTDDITVSQLISTLATFIIIAGVIGLAIILVKEYSGMLDMKTTNGDENMENDVKGLLQSRTFWAQVAIVLVWFAQTFGFDVGPNAVASTTNWLITGAGGLAVLAAFWFNFKRKGNIKGLIVTQDKSER